MFSDTVPKYINLYLRKYSKNIYLENRRVSFKDINDDKGQQIKDDFFLCSHQLQSITINYLTSSGRFPGHLEHPRNNAFHYNIHKAISFVFQMFNYFLSIF